MSAKKIDSAKHEEMLNTVVGYLEGKSYEDIRINLDNYDKPARLSRQGSTEEGYTPDATARKKGCKFYFDVVTASKDERVTVTSKWRLLSTLAEHRDGKLVLFVPYGKMNFTNEILQNHQISAEVIRMQDIESTRNTAALTE